MEDRFVPLFAFASSLELFGTFPECKDFVQNNIRLGEIVELPEERGFAVVLGVGLLEFSTNLSVLLSRFAYEGPFTHVVLAGRGLGRCRTRRLVYALAQSLRDFDKCGCFSGVCASLRIFLAEGRSHLAF